MSNYHMTSDDFRRHGRELIDWIADYMDRVEELPVVPDVKPGELRARLPEPRRSIPKRSTACLRTSTT